MEWFTLEQRRFQELTALIEFAHIYTYMWEPRALNILNHPVSQVCSTVGDVQYRRENNTLYGKHHEYCGICSVKWGGILSTVEGNHDVHEEVPLRIFSTQGETLTAVEDVQ